jgi:rhodanese-related sulfurtransferase
MKASRAIFSKAGLMGMGVVVMLLPAFLFAADLKPDETFDFQKGILGSEVKHDFHLVNSGSDALTLQEVKSSCECTRITSFPKTITAGQTGIISIATKLDRTGGKDVFVTAIIAGKPSHVFEIEGEVAADTTAATAPDLWAEPGELLAKSHADLTYIDIRQGALFDQAHVRRSMNVPIYALNTLTYLKSKPIVVIGDGTDDAAMAPSIEKCRQAGFTSIRIMRGGIRQWQQAGGSLEGVFSQKPPLAKVSAMQLLNSADHSSWMVLVPPSIKNDPKLASQNQVKVLSYDDIRNVEAIAKAALSKNAGVVGVAVFAVSDQDREVLSREVPALDRPLFVVNEPWTDFTTLLASQALEKESAIKTVSSGPLTHRLIGCPTCP